MRVLRRRGLARLWDWAGRPVLLSVTSGTAHGELVHVDIKRLAKVPDRGRSENHSHNGREGVDHRHPAGRPLTGRRVVRLPDVMEITGLMQKPPIWRRERDGSFP